MGRERYVVRLEREEREVGLIRGGKQEGGPYSLPGLGTEVCGYGVP